MDITDIVTSASMCWACKALRLKAVVFSLSQQRHRSDKKVNNRSSKVLREGELVDEKWHNIVVGDIIRLENNQFVTVSLTSFAKLVAPFVMIITSAKGLCLWQLLGIQSTTIEEFEHENPQDRATDK